MMATARDDGDDLQGYRINLERKKIFNENLITNRRKKKL